MLFDQFLLASNDTNKTLVFPVLCSACCVQTDFLQKPVKATFVLLNALDCPEGSENRGRIEAHLFQLTSWCDFEVGRRPLEDPLMSLSYLYM